MALFFEGKMAIGVKFCLPIDIPIKIRVNLKNQANLIFIFSFIVVNWTSLNTKQSRTNQVSNGKEKYSFLLLKDKTKINVNTENSDI